MSLNSLVTRNGLKEIREATTEEMRKDMRQDRTITRIINIEATIMRKTKPRDKSTGRTITRRDRSSLIRVKEDEAAEEEEEERLAMLSINAAPTRREMLVDLSRRYSRQRGK